jgi:hypothetical protein
MLLEDGVTEAQLQQEHAITAGFIDSAKRYGADYPEAIAAFMPSDEPA